MLVITAKSWAIVVCVLGMFCSGTWPTFHIYVKRRQQKRSKSPPVPLVNFYDTVIVWCLVAIIGSFILGVPSVIL